MTTRTMTLKPVFARKTKKSPAFLGRRLVIPSDTPASVTLDEASASAPAAQPRRRFRCPVALVPRDARDRSSPYAHPDGSISVDVVVSDRMKIESDLALVRQFVWKASATPVAGVRFPRSLLVLLARHGASRTLTFGGCASGEAAGLEHRFWLRPSRSTRPSSAMEGAARAVRVLGFEHQGRFDAAVQLRRFPQVSLGG